MLELSDLESEATRLAEQLRRSRCCDALLPCYRCSLLRFNFLARRRVVEIPGPPRPARGNLPVRVAVGACAGELRAS